MKIQLASLISLLLILLGALKSFSNEAVPNQYNLEVSIRTNTFRIIGPSNDQMELLGIHQLSATDFNNFLKTRNDFINHAARLLQNLKYGFGIGYIIKDKYQFHKEKKQSCSALFT